MFRNSTCSRALLCAFAATLASAACSEDVGQVVVLVHSDYSVPSELESVRAIIRGTDGGTDDYLFELAAKQIELPFSFGLQPSDPDTREDAVLEIEALGDQLAGALQVRRKFVEFPDSGTYLLPVFLARTCAGQMCPSGQTCGVNGCESEEVRISDLSEVDEGEEFDVPSCMVGQRRCSADRTASEICLADGFPFTQEVCPNNSSCNPMTGVCEGVVGQDVQLQIVIQGAPADMIVIDVEGGGPQSCLSPGCTLNFARGSNLTITPRSSSFSEFVGFIPTNVCSSSPCMLTLNDNLSFTAGFVPVVQVNVAGPGQVDASVGGGAITTCVSGAPCRVRVPGGQTVNLNALPNIDARFDNWMAPGCGTAPVCDILINQGQAVTANFSSVVNMGFELTVGDSHGAQGRIESEPPGINCPGSCSAVFPEFSFVTLRAYPANNQAFAGWHNGPCQQYEECFVYMDSPRSQDAQFTPLASGGQIEVRPVGPGSVVDPSDTGNLDCGIDCWGDYPAGTPITIEARPSIGSVVLGWADPVCSYSTDNFCMISSVMTHIVVEPIFSEPRPPLHDLNADGAEDLAIACPKEGVMSNLDVGRLYFAQGPLPAARGQLGSSATRVWQGSEVGERFGTSVAFVDDINGDGLFDLAVGAPGYDQGRGAVYIISGNTSLPPSGSLPAVQIITGENRGDEFGRTIVGSFDSDGDGDFEMLVGAPMAGRVYLFRGSNTFTQTSASQADLIWAGNPAARFGTSIAALGNFANDGMNYFAIGAPDAMITGQPYGRVNVVPDQPSLSPGTVIAVDGTQSPWNWEGGPGATRIGYSMTALGDWDSDGLADLAFGTFGDDRVFVTRGDRANLFSGVATAQTGLNQLAAPGAFGRSITAVDVTGDGVQDLVVGAPFEGGSPNLGGVHIFAGEPGAPVNAPVIIQSSCQTTLDCLTESFGMRVGPAGDVNNDGVQDLAVGSVFGGGNAGISDRGRVAIFFGGIGVPVSSNDAQILLTGPPGSSGECMVVPATDPLFGSF